MPVNHQRQKFLTQNSALISLMDISDGEMPAEIFKLDSGLTVLVGRNYGFSGVETIPLAVNCSLCKTCRLVSERGTSPTQRKSHVYLPQKIHSPERRCRWGKRRGTPSRTAELTSIAASWIGTGPLFVAAGLESWNMMPSDAKTLVDSLGSQFEVVRPDVFFELIRQSQAG